MAIHDAGMFTVKGINRLKILQDAIDRNLHPGQAAETLSPTRTTWHEHNHSENALFPVKRYDKQAQFFYVTAP